MSDAPGLPTDVDELHKMIGDLRKEAADYRTKYNPFKEAFSGFNDAEQKFLLDLVGLTGDNPDAGAIGFRDMAKDMLGDKFTEGLDLPAPEPADEEPAPEADSKDDEVANLSLEDIKALLDERDNARVEAQQKQSLDAEVEQVYAEIEAAGFERGTEGFAMMLQMASVKAQRSESVDFTELAPKVAGVLDIELPSAEKPTEEEKPAEEKGKEFPSSADLSPGAGSPGEKPKDWIAEAVEAGKSPMEAARERAEARLAGD